ncbi:MAG: hypothetical protein WCI18_13390 [Pseudomonadota bacterium]
MNLRYDFEKVSVSSFKKENLNHECYLVTAWSESAMRPIELLTSVPVLNSDQALDIVINYLSRWSVEETYRFLKAACGLEEMRLFSFGKLRNLVRASFLTASLIARMSRHSGWQRLFCRTALRLKRAPDELYNWLYRSSDACSALLTKHLKLLLAAVETIYHNRKIKRYFQPCLFPGEIGL